VKPPSLSERLRFLNSLKTSLIKHEKEILHALELDLGKNPIEGYLTELGFLLGEIDHALKSLSGWMKPVVVSTPWLFMPARSWYEYRPFGEILIIAPWNYPFQLCLAPLVGALAAGNKAILKPSEHAPSTAQVIEKVIIAANLDQQVRVVHGGVEETQALIASGPDLIFFTGSTEVGRAIMRSAAENLTPVVLELGGKSPCVIYQCESLKIACKRIAWGKFLNAGQTCVAPDYLMVQEEDYEQVLVYLKEAITELFGADPLQSKSLGSMIHDRHFQGLLNLLERETILTGGVSNKETLKIAPTLVLNSSADEKLMKREIFGPILPILIYKSKEEIFKQIQKDPKPLAAYVFTSESNFEEEFRERVLSGGLCVNDVVVHLGNKNLPFGGVGPSGMGQYHGHHSFLAFSHKRACMKRSFWFENALRYPPYKNSLNFFKRLMRWLS
jgi:aldehyde dehydrogenase (NAD+)